MVGKPNVCRGDSRDNWSVCPQLRYTRSSFGVKRLHGSFRIDAGWRCHVQCDG